MNSTCVVVIGGGSLACTAILRMCNEKMAEIPSLAFIFIVRSSSEFWSIFASKDEITVHNTNDGNITHTFRLLVYNSSQSYEEFIEACKSTSKIGIIISDSIAETVSELKQYTDLFCTCCGNAFRQVVDIVAKSHKSDEKFDIIGFENDHSNRKETFPELSNDYPNMEISFAVCDCIADRRKIINDEIYVEAELKATIYSMDYNGINFSYNLSENMISVSSKETISILSSRKRINLNIPHAVMSYLYMHRKYGSIRYDVIKPFENEKVCRAFDSFDKIYADVFALYFSLKHGKEENLSDFFETTYRYCLDNVERFSCKLDDTIGRVIHLENETAYRVKLNNIYESIIDIEKEFQKSDAGIAVKESHIEVDFLECLKIVKKMKNIICEEKK